MSNLQETLRITDSDPQWPVLFEAERAQLEEVLAPWLDGGVHHVGSTAVPGLAAAPTVDILAGLASPESAEPAVSALRAGGWQEAPSHVAEIRRLFKPSADPPDFHLRLMPRSSDRFDDEIDLREALRADSDLAQAFGLLKRELAARHPDDRQAYNQAKAGFIAGVLRAQHETRASLRPPSRGPGSVVAP